MADVTYQLIDTDRVTVLGAVPLVRAGSGRAGVALSGFGSGRIDIDAGENPVGDLVSTYTYGRYIRVLVDAVAVATWKIEGPALEQGRQILESHLGVAGRGWVADFASALVESWVGTNQDPAPDYRIFNFASPEYPSLDPIVWVPTTLQVKVSDPATVRKIEDAAGVLQPAPIGWSDPDAYWVWSSDSQELGRKYFRTVFTVPPGGAEVAIEMTGDNYWTGYLDGVPVFGESELLAAWSKLKRFERFLPAGVHHLAAVVDNVDHGITPNPGGWAYSVFTMDSNGDPDVVLKRSGDGSEIVNDVGTADPGWTAGDALLTALSEAQARGELLGWSFGFDGDVDSAGVSWPRLPFFAVGIGEPISALLELLHDDGAIDYLARPDAPVLDCWVAGTTSASATVLRNDAASLVSGGADIALDDVDFAKTERAPDRILVRYTRGYVEVGGPGLGGSALLTVDTDLASEAIRLGNHALDAAAARVARVSAVIDPIDAATTPFSGFGIRSLVQVPDEVGVLQALPTVGLTVIDRGVEPVFHGEWSARRIPRQARQQQLIQTLGSSVMGTVPGSRPRSASANGGYTPASIPVTYTPPIRAPRAIDLPSGSGGGGGGGSPVWVPVVPVISDVTWGTGATRLGEYMIVPGGILYRGWVEFGTGAASISSVNLLEIPGGFAVREGNVGGGTWNFGRVLYYTPSLVGGDPVGALQGSDFDTGLKFIVHDNEGTDITRDPVVAVAFSALPDHVEPGAIWLWDAFIPCDSGWSGGSGGGGGGLAELPPFSLGGVVRVAFGAPMRTGKYVSESAVTIDRLDWTLVELDEVGPSSGPIFKLYVAGVLAYTSARILADGGAAVSVAVAAGETVQVQVDDHGRGSAVGLTVMARIS